jgi:hypothetical protein
MSPLGGFILAALNLAWGFVLGGIWGVRSEQKRRARAVPNGGPTLAEGEAPFPLGWEQVDDTCEHEWETVLLLVGRRVEEVVRCEHCHAPRCGHVHDDDPCMKRRHHRDCHRYLSGRREHLSGLATTCGCR